MQEQIFFCPCPWGPREGSKCQISLNFNNKVNFKDFYIKLCVFLQIQDTKYIKRDFYSDSCVMPQQWDLWTCGRQGWPWGQNNFFFEHGHVAYQIDGDDE